MTNPLTPDPGEMPPQPVDETVENPVKDHHDDNEALNKRYIVKTVWHCDSFTGENFPEITPHGTEMSGQERQNAYEAAKVNDIALRSKEVS